MRGDAIILLTSLGLFFGLLGFLIYDDVGGRVEKHSVEVVAITYKSPLNKHSEEVVVRWGDKNVAVKAHPIHTKYIKVGDRVTVAEYRSAFLGTLEYRLTKD